MPAGDFKDLVNKTSYMGWTGNLMYGINNKISVGLGTGFQDYYQKYPRDVYKLTSGGDISAVITNSVQTIPILAMSHYNFLPAGKVQPYAGVGVGAVVVMYRQYLGEFDDSRNKTGFAVRPEAGVYIPFSKYQESAGITINAVYNYMKFGYNGLDNVDSWGIGAGIKFPLH